MSELSPEAVKFIEAFFSYFENLEFTSALTLAKKYANTQSVLSKFFLSLVTYEKYYYTMTHNDQVLSCSLN